MFLRNMFEYALKSNDSLKFAVLTGCMHISKKSIFTGRNNLKVLSVVEVQFDECFGFTDGEVREMLEYYGFLSHYEEIKEWYDGYQFGNVEVYCPWDVINYCDALRVDSDAQPKNYWSNTSGNEAVRRFIQESDKAAVRRKVEKLVAGEIITKEIHHELTYKDMYASVDNLWSLLFTTGYLTQRGKPEGDSFRLAIPNMEIRKIFTAQIMDFFKEGIPKNGEAWKEFCEALKNGEPKRVEKLLGEYLKRTISICDTFVKKRMKENFYHGIILVETDDGEIGIVIELKYAEDGKMEAACQGALTQIEQKRYEEELLDEGVEHILKYGIAFYKKRCQVMLASYDESFL